MKIGITVNFQFSFFSGGGGSYALGISELCKQLGHEVVLVNTNGRQEWWDDIKILRADYSVLHVEDWKQKVGHEKPLDLVLEVTSTLSKEVRAALSNTSVWIVRKPILLHDIENSIFPLLHVKRDLEGISAIWAIDTEITKDELGYLSILGRGVPVHHVSFVWTSTYLDAHRKETNSPEWIQLLAFFVQQKNALPAWSVHIPETNTSASSSCTIPLVALREVKRTTNVPLGTYKVHNADHIQKSEFFLGNVLKHTQISDLSGGFFGRQRISDWIFDPASMVFCHSRFRAIRPLYIDALYTGIPIVHNSSLLKDLGGEYWYPENSITGAVDAFSKLHHDLLSGQGMFQQGYLEKIRKTILDRFGPTAPAVQGSWKQALDELKIVPRTVAVANVPVPVAALPPVSPSSATVRVVFTDMWDDFNPTYNMFLLMMKEALRLGGIDVRVEGYTSGSLPGGEKASLLVFGPFGDEWKDARWKGVPKVHFTGENTPPVKDTDVVLNLGFAHADFVDDRYIRLPLWMLEIDWFGADMNKLQNPKPLPIDRCTKVYPEEIGDKKKFCAFVVTNPCNTLRNNAFHWLSQYKQVDSAGRLFNNVGDAIFAGRGGGGGELLKHNFLKQYKFCLSFENASSQGYTTEKLLHAKAAGCIPIYWGDPKIERDFDTNGFIDARHIQTSTELIDLVKKIDSNPSLYLRMLSVPALDEYKRDLVRRTLREVAYLMLKHSGLVSKDQLERIPKMIGATSSEEAAELSNYHSDLGNQVKQNPVTLPVVSTPREPGALAPPLIVTYATHQYLASVQQLLAGFSIQKQHIPELEIRAYVSSDVPKEALKLLSENYNQMKFIEVPDQTPPEGGFSDFWTPQHFAWKLWLYNTLNSDPELKDRLVLYLDAGIFCSRWPTEWLHLAYDKGVCVLEDPRQINEQWCHDVFKQRMNMTYEENQAHQIVAGIMAFRAGSPEATSLFSEAYRLGKQRDLIVGEKWSGTRNGKPYGHRHDQSILSLLAHRQKVATYPLDEVYCNVSLRKTFISGKAFYVHRGQFFIHKQFAPGIDDAYVINLDRRKDRMKKLYENSPSLELRVERISAFEGKNLTLTPELARLFKPHDFMWKKAIMGCALSHLSLWYRLVNEKKDINSYLILEDDVKLQPDWEARWTEAQPHIPEDYDILYLGGILPPNRDAFERSKEKVNAHWSRVAKNQVFGQTPPNAYFHWCAYAYVLSKQGAEKVMKLLHAHDGYWTSADHMLCNHVEHMNIYFLDPLVAGCYQDDDPVYRTSAFNNFNRVDTFDSDLWNNDERFSAEEVGRCLSEAESKPLDVKEALLQVVSQQLKVKEEILNHSSPKEQQTFKERILPLITQPPSPRKKRLVCLKEHNLIGPELYEATWLKELFGKDVPLEIDKISPSDEPPSDTPIVIYQKHHFAAYEALFHRWEAAGKSYYILHLSDEFVSDPIGCYSNPHCLGVIRMYDRPDIPADVRKKMVLIPLGYHFTLGDGSDNPAEKTPRLPFRTYRWSFVGTNWAGRDSSIEPFKRIEPNKLLLLSSWESKEKIARQEYLSVLLDTYFVPCFAGNNNETYRLYEALECGCVPLYVKQGGGDTYADYLLDNLGIMPTSNWEEAVKLMEHLLSNIALLENYRTMILNRWIVFKKKLHDDLLGLLQM